MGWLAKATAYDYVYQRNSLLTHAPTTRAESQAARVCGRGEVRGRGDRPLKIEHRREIVCPNVFFCVQRYTREFWCVKNLTGRGRSNIVS